MEKEFIDRLNRAYFIIILTGLIMIVSLFIYAGAVEYIKREYAPFEGFSGLQETDILRYLLWGTSLLLFFLIGIAGKRILAGMTLSYGTNDEAIKFSSSIKKLSTASMISYAFSESIAICGLVLFLLSGKSSDYYAFMILSLVSFAVYFPRHIKWEKYLRKFVRL